MTHLYKTASSEVVFQAGGATGRRIHSQNDCEYVYLSIEPDSKIDSHALGVPVTFYIITGNGFVSLDSNEYQVEAGDLIEIARDVKREWKNNSDSVLELLVIKHLSGG